MLNIQNHSWRKGFILSATFLLSVFIITSCKKQENSLGLNSLSQSELLSSGGVDTFTLYTSSIFEDTVITDNPNLSVLGSYNDPVFGKTNSEIYTQFRLSALNPNFGTDPIVVDSFVLALEYESSFYGKRGNQTFQVFEIIDADGLSIDSTYYSFSTMDTTGVNLIVPGKESQKMDPSQLTILAGDTLNNSQLRLPLDPAKGQAIIDEFFNNPATFESNENFLEYFKGLHISTNNGLQSSGEGGLFYFSLNDSDSKLTIYYTQNGIQGTFDLVINSSCADFTHVDIDHTGTNVASVLSTPANGLSEFYAQSFGTRAVIQIPGISDIPKNSVIHKATLELPIQDQTGLNLAPSGLISISTRKTAGEDYFFTGIFGTYDASRKQYTIDLRSYVQAILSGELENTELILAPVSYISSADRIIFNGSQTTNKEKPKLSIIYTEY